MTTSALAQAFWGLAIRWADRGSVMSKFAYAILQPIRRAMVALLNDPNVTYALDGSVLKIPLSHELPFIRARYPSYSTNIGRVAVALEAKYPDLTMVDIGANVGDTVAIVRRLTHFPILCIDGDPRFFSLLEENSKQWQKILLENSFVGETTSSLTGHVEVVGGTGHLVPDSTSTTPIHTRTLSAILEAFPDFAAPKIVKIDTDGFDTKIIKCEQGLLGRLKPVIFFEYDPYFFGNIDRDGFSVFDSLKSAGYTTAMFFENTGEFLVCADLDNFGLLEDLHHFYSDRGGLRYADVCVFAAEDADVLAKVRSEELNRTSSNARHENVI